MFVPLKLAYLRKSQESTMKIPIQKTSDVITAYIVEKLVPHASVTGKVKLGFILPIIPSYLATQIPLGVSMGLIDESANVDMTMFEKCSKSAISCAEKMTIAGFTFGKEDIDNFFAYFAEHTKGLESSPVPAAQVN